MCQERLPIGRLRCGSYSCEVHGVVGMMTARVITTILRPPKPIRTSIVVMTLAVIILRKNMKFTQSLDNSPPTSLLKVPSVRNNWLE